MEIFFLTEAGTDIGYGHLFRCLSIYQAFEERGFKSSIIVNCDGNLDNVLTNTNYVITNWEKNPNDIFDKLSYSDILIIDSYTIGTDLISKLQFKYNKIAIIDDYNRRKYNSGIVIDWTVNIEFENKYEFSQNVKYLLGTSYTALRKDFWDIKPKQINYKVSTIFVSFGGSDVKNLTPKVLEILNRNFRDIKCIAIIGNGYLKSQNIKNFRNVILEYNCSATEMKDHMLNCDLAISTGGQTLYELARTGTPTITIGTVDNSTQDILGWGKVNFTECAGNWDDHNLEGKLVGLVYKFKSKKNRQVKSIIGQSLIDGQGCFRICDSILNQYSNHSL